MKRTFGPVTAYAHRKYRSGPFYIGVGVGSRTVEVMIS